MRIGTRTLKVTAWLSGITLGLAAVGYLIPVNSLLIVAATKHWYATMAQRAISIGWNSRPGIDPGVAFLHSDASPVDKDAPWIWLPTLDHDRQATFLIIPLWLPALVALGIGASAFVTLRRRARAIKNGACPHCGYALIGIAPTAPCPECGRAKAAHE